MVGIVVLVALLTTTAYVFAHPYFSAAADGGERLNRYFPISSGHSGLAAVVDAAGKEQGWVATNMTVLADFRTFTDLPAIVFSAISQLYTKSPTDELPAGLADATVYQINVAASAADGTPSGAPLGEVIARDATGDRLIAVLRGGQGADSVLDPPAALLPATLKVGDTWNTTGTVSPGGGPFTVTGKVLEATRGPAGLHDCLRVQVSVSVLGPGSARLIACAGVGIVDEEDLDAQGALTTHLRYVTVDERRLLDHPPIPGAPTGKDQPVPAGPWEVTRAGRGSSRGSGAHPTFVPTFVPGATPMVLAAAEDTDLVAIDPVNPGAVLWRFHPGGTLYGAPGFDPATGRVYVGSTDRRLYALDGRGAFLWSFEAGDNIASRPAAANGVVVFASEDRHVYGVDAATGQLRWKHEVGTSSVSSAAIVQGVAVIGGDDGVVHGYVVKTGDERWSKALEGPVEGAIVSDGTDVFVADGSGGVTSFDPATGDQRWATAVHDEFRTAPAIGDGLLAVVGTAGELHVLDANSGKERWSAGGRLVGPPAIGGQAVVAPRAGGVLAVFDEQGQLEGELDTAVAVDPGEAAPSYTLGVSAGGGAFWLADDNTVVRRVGAPLAGAARLDVRWAKTSGDAPFVGSSFPGSVGEFEGRAVVVGGEESVFLVDPTTGIGRRVAGSPTDPPATIPLTGAVVSGNTVIFGNNKTLRAVDLSDGSETWTHPITGFLVHPPVVAGGLVIADELDADDPTTPKGTIEALDVRSGAVRWTATMTRSGGGPTIAGGVVVTGSPLSAFDARTGAPRWQRRDGGTVEGAPVFDQRDGTVIAAERVVSADGQSATLALVAVDAATGQQRWSQPLAASPDLPDLLRVVGGTVVVPGTGGSIAGFDAATGAPRWTFPSLTRGKRLGTLGVAAGLVWTFTDIAGVLAFDPATGKIAARFGGFDNSIESSQSFFFTQPVAVGDTVIIPMGALLVGIAVPERAP